MAINCLSTEPIIDYSALYTILVSQFLTIFLYTRGYDYNNFFKNLLNKATYFYYLMISTFTYSPFEREKFIEQKKRQLQLDKFLKPYLQKQELRFIFIESIILLPVYRFVP